MKILGIGLSHCSGVVLIDDGRVVFAQEEDRFSHRRRHKGWPKQSLEYTLKKYNIKEEDIDLCVICDIQTAKRVEFNINAKKVISIHHHLAHVMSGWALVDWPDFDVVTIDGGGDHGSWQSYGTIQDRKLVDWESNCGTRLSPKGIVHRQWFKKKRPGRTFGAYWSAPAVANFGMVDSDGVGGYEGKLMGLAGHGDGSRFDRLANNYDAEFSVKKIGKYYQIVTKGSPKIGDSKNIVTKDGRRINLAKARLMRKSGNIVCEYDLKDEHDLAFAADFANHLQNMTSDVVLELFERNFTKDRPIVVSGGTFANVVTNGILNKKYNIFITPPMGDEGLALGAAAWGAYISDIRKLNIKNMYLGFDTGTNSNVDLTRIGEMLADGKVVGLIEGKMELGPRALGARTILADPRDINANLTINERLGRVEYMPFAPVILEEYASDILVDWSPKHLSSRHMTVIYAVHDKWKEKLKGVVHVDGTVRPQVICRKDNKVYYDIVEAFFKCTGIPVLINTSFNSHGEPIVRTIDDGLRALKSGRVDVLVAGNKITLTDDMEDTAVNL